MERDQRATAYQDHDTNLAQFYYLILWLAAENLTDAYYVHHDVIDSTWVLMLDGRG